ncbi:carbohydrate ABC transporter permease [Alicyclobacillus mengziensis]|uniref:Maltose/maltodextrin transport system permease protein n=1 Tax=Alicyclobacillus mengziensis TaxID=2931921 RepID=A0A9X7W1S8_9BACL|nr:sugar ABC transporter permease [Alicyclobacillus mengziensis]QSO49074.1 sugar ABC transporter permease [Alicyclobacillus mengziensis]
MSTVVFNESQKRKKVQWISYAYLSPALFTISILSLLPIGYTIYIGFTNFDAMHFLHYNFVGLQNFKELFNPHNPLSTVFFPTLLWTFEFAIISTVLNYFVGLFLAMLLNNRNIREAAVYRAILIIPWAIPGLITMLAWQGLLNDSYGQINAFLHVFGIPAVPWLLNAVWAKVAIIMVNLWAGFPYMMTVCLGALQAVPGELYEASSIDGANWWAQFRFVTVPEIWKITLPLIIPTFAFNFNNFNAVYLLTNGGPARSDNQFVGHTDILASAAYKMTLQFNRYDWAAAISIILFIIVGLLSFVQMKYTHAFEEVD